MPLLAQSHIGRLFWGTIIYNRAWLQLRPARWRQVQLLRPAVGQPYALWWNIIGFAVVGALLAGFGLTYGCILQDRFVGVLLALYGVGFGATGVPIDLGDGSAPLSKAHVVAICLGLAAWMFGLARMAYLPSLGKSVRISANIAAALLVLPILGQGAQLWSMPVTHRLVFLVVFGWIAITSIGLLRGVGPEYVPDRKHAADSASETSPNKVDTNHNKEVRVRSVHQ